MHQKQQDGLNGNITVTLFDPFIDPFFSKHYRPIVISTTFSKLLEIRILEQCGEHEFDNLQLGLCQVGVQQWRQQLATML